MPSTRPLKEFKVTTTKGEVITIRRRCAGTGVTAQQQMNTLVGLDALYARADRVEPDLNAWSGRREEQAYAAAVTPLTFRPSSTPFAPFPIPTTQPGTRGAPHSRSRLELTM